MRCSPMTRVVKVLTAAAKNKWKQRARRRQLRQRTGYDGPVNLPVGSSFRCLMHLDGHWVTCSSRTSQQGI